MRKLKTQKGITLVALIITIVVLLILAGVAIGTVKNSDIIGYAKNAASAYENEKTNEEDMIDKYENEIKDNILNEEEIEYYILENGGAIAKLNKSSYTLILYMVIKGEYSKVSDGTEIRLGDQITESIEVEFYDYNAAKKDKTILQAGAIPLLDENNKIGGYLENEKLYIGIRYRRRGKNTILYHL